MFHQMGSGLGAIAMSKRDQVLVFMDLTFCIGVGVSGNRNE